MRGWNRRVFVPAMLIAMLAVAGCQKGGAVTTAADEAAVKKVLADIVTTFNAGDYEGMFALYEDDVLVQSSAAPEITSKEAWRETLKATLPPDVKLQMGFDTSELKVAGDMAYERGVFTIGTAGAADQPAMFKGRYIHILKRNSEGEWKGWRLFEIIDQMPPQLIPAGGAAPAVQ